MGSKPLPIRPRPLVSNVRPRVQDQNPSGPKTRPGRQAVLQPPLVVRPHDVTPQSGSRLRRPVPRPGPGGTLTVVHGPGPNTRRRPRYGRLTLGEGTTPEGGPWGLGPNVPGPRVKEVLDTVVHLRRVPLSPVGPTLSRFGLGPTPHPYPEVQGPPLTPDPTGPRLKTLPDRLLVLRPREHP